nr:unnamed protein product [Spirometra erinaceieuropaei]
MLPGEECCVPMVSTAPMTVGCSFCEPVQNTTPPDEHLLLTPNARDGHLNAPSAATLAPAGLCPRPEAGPAGQRQSRVPTGGPTIASSSRRCGFACSLAGNLKPNRLQRVHDVNGHPGRQLDLLDTSGPTAAPGLHQPPSLRPLLPRLSRRQLTLIVLPNHHYHPSPLPSPSFTASMSAAVASAMAIVTINNPDMPTNTNTTTVNTCDEDRVYTCSHFYRTFTSHIDLVGHLQIHRTETGEPVPAAPVYNRLVRLYCPHYTVTFIHRMVY